MQLGRVSAALGKFLEDDLSPTYLGITTNARSHLDRFQRFLHGFYVEKFGYWPPPRGSSFPKALYKSMYYDFKNLYDYLVDTESSNDISAQAPARGGICALQNVNSFDQRHGFKALPHPLPLLPNHVSTAKKTESQKALRQLTLASQHNKTHQLHAMSAALAVATNTLSQDILNTHMLQAYMQFERVYAINASQREDKLPAADARKVRWLVIYGTLQYLVSALRAPKEVRDSDSPDYALCCVAEKSTWQPESKIRTPIVASPSNLLSEKTDYFPDQQTSPFTIQPDCQRGDYFTLKTSSRRGSVEMPSPLSGTQPHRQTSLRSFAPRSLSLRSSRNSRRDSLTLKPTPHCAIIIQGYGDGTNEAVTTQAPQEGPRPTSSIYSRPISSVYSARSSLSVLPDGASPDSSWLRSRTPSAPHSRKPSITTSGDFARPRTPLLDSMQLEGLTGLEAPRTGAEPPCRSDSTGSTASSIWSEGASVASSKSSADSETYSPYKTSTAEHSGLLGGLVSIDSSPVTTVSTQSLTTCSVPQSHIHPLLRQVSRQEGFEFNFNANASETTESEVRQTAHEPAIGMAFSAPPSPPAARISTDPLFTQPSQRTMSLTTEKQPYFLHGTTSTGSALSEKTRPMKVSSPLAQPTSEMWEQYKAALTRPTERSSSNSPTSMTPPPPMLKSPHAFKLPSFRSSSRLSNQEEENKKKDRRLSSLWRR